jgi:hypothetical protein
LDGILRTVFDLRFRDRSRNGGGSLPKPNDKYQGIRCAKLSFDEDICRKAVRDGLEVVSVG